MKGFVGVPIHYGNQEMCIRDSRKGTVCVGFDLPGRCVGPAGSRKLLQTTDQGEREYGPDKKSVSAGIKAKCRGYIPLKSGNEQYTRCV